jgi:hypothetical protein
MSFKFGENPKVSQASRNFNSSLSTSESLNEDPATPDGKVYQNSIEFYEKGQRDMLLHLCDLLKKNLGLLLPSDSPTSFIKGLACILVEKPCFLKYHTIECESAELIEMHHDIYRLLKSAEMGYYYEGKVKLNDLKVYIKIKQNSYSIADKGEISQQFCSFGTDCFDDVGLDKEFRNFKKLEILEEFEANFIKENSEKFDKDIDYAPNYKSYGLTYDISVIKYQKQQQKIIESKEWEKQEALNLKLKSQMKKKKLDHKKNELLQMEKDLKKKTLALKKKKTNWIG